MEFQIEVPGGAKVRLADLPIDVLGECARAGDLRWLDMLNRPLYDDRAYAALYRACCAHAGAEPVAVLKANELVEALQLVEDDLPSSFVDGNPKAADAPATPG